MKNVLIITFLISLSINLKCQLIKEHRILLNDSIQSLKLKKEISNLEDIEVFLTNRQLKNNRIFWEKSIEAIYKSIEYSSSATKDNRAKMRLAYEILIKKAKKMPDKKRKKINKHYLEIRNVYIKNKLKEEKLKGKLEIDEYDFIYFLFSTEIPEVDDLKSARIITFKIVGLLDKGQQWENPQKIESQGVDRLIRLVKMGLNKSLVLNDFRYLLRIYRDSHPINGYSWSGGPRDLTSERDKKVNDLRKKINKETNLGVNIEPKEMEKYR